MKFKRAIVFIVSVCTVPPYTLTMSANISGICSHSECVEVTSECVEKIPGTRIPEKTQKVFSTHLLQGGQFQITSGIVENECLLSLGMQ